MNFKKYFSLLIMCICIGCSKADNAQESKNLLKNSYTLDICGRNIVKNPTLEDIKTSLLKIKNGSCKETDSFIVLLKSDYTYIQTAYNNEFNIFLTDYQEEDIKHHYDAKDDMDFQTTLKIFSLYLKDDQAWKNKALWIHRDID